MASSEGMKVWFWRLLNVVLVVVALVGLMTTKFLKESSQSRFPARSITVSAEGKSVAIPDVMRFSFSVVSEGTDPKALQEANIPKVNKAIEFVKSKGIDPKDIKTSQYNLEPRYNYDRFTGESQIFGYMFTQTVTVKVRKDKFDVIGSLLEALPGQGINQVTSLSFEVDDPEVYLRDARKEAFDKVHAKAMSMAEQNGVRLGRVITFNDNYGGYPYPMYKGLGAEAGGAVRDASVPPNIEPGSQEISVSVNVTYEVK